MPSSAVTRAARGWLVLLLGASCASRPALAAPPAEPGAPAASAAAANEIVERVMAVVDSRPLLLSDVRALALVRGLGESDALEEAIAEQLMYTEASRLPEAEVGSEDETAALALLVQREPAVRERVPEPQLRRLVHRQIAILRYVEFRFRPQVRISDEQVRREWEAQEVGRPAGLALEDAQDAIRARLERRALDERVEAWVGELRARADVRVVPPTPTPGGPAPER
ncbi:MAG TPA: hypothetical protein VEQ10_17845 [Vicinamibacteria bacterium]|nr:hypothetical protein [Vicinamibacteria bacterium]